jgi:hypothetical protein
MKAERKSLADDRHYEVEAVLAWHDDNARAAISTLLDDCRYLRAKLAQTRGDASDDATPGWVPKSRGD